MAALVATYNGDLLAPDWLRRDTRPVRTGPIDTHHELRVRIKALAGLWEQSHLVKGGYTAKSHVDSTQVAWETVYAGRELFRPIATPQVAGVPQPPPCDDDLPDAPPDYTLTEGLATAQLNVCDVDAPGKDARAANTSPRSATDEIDLTSPSGVRSHVNKKAKKAAKSAQKDKWAGSDDEGEKPAEGGEEGGAGDGAGGDAGFGAGGDGGDPPGDGGNGGNGEDGGDGDDWATGASTAKGKKKKKKNAWEEFEADEAAKKVDDENADATPAAAAEPDAADDWGAFASVGGKKKKGKKGQPEPEAVADPVLDTIDLGGSATLDATPATATEPDAADEWGFSGGKKKKGAKKGKNDPLPPPPPPAPENDMKFDEVNLNDDKLAPKLDLDFGLDAPAAETKSSGFSFGGGWGGGWGGSSSGGGAGAKATSSWGLGGTEEDKVGDIPKADDSWNFGAISGPTPAAKKDKKKKGGFDFDFDDLGGDAGDAGAATGDFASSAKAETLAEPDPWSFASTPASHGAKAKKGAKKGVVEVPAEIDIPPPPPPPVEEVKEDEFSSFAFGSKKDKKKGKKAGFASEPQSAIEPDPVPEPVVMPEAPAEGDVGGDDSWGGFGLSAKDKKKAKKSGKAGQTPFEEPAIVVVPEPVAEPQAAVMDDFGFGASKKDKKKKGKSAFEDFDEKVIDVPPPPPPAPVEEPLPVEDPYGFPTAGSKKKKGSKKSAFDDIAPPTPAVPDPIVEERAGGDDWLGGWGGKSGAYDSPAGGSNFMQPDAVVEPKVDDPWSTGTRKKGARKDTAKGIVEVIDPSPGASILLPESIQDKSAEEEPSWSAFGAVGKKDKKKAGKKGIVEPEPAFPPPPPAQGFDDLSLDTAPALVDFNETPADEFTSASSKKSKLKKGAKGIVESPTDTKLSKTKSRDKYSPDDIIDIVDEAPAPPLPTLPVEPVAESPHEEKKASKWGLWGSSKTSSSTKSTKDKDREAKEAAEQTAREKKEADKAAAAEEQRKADDALFAAAMGEDPDEILDIIDEAPPKKSAKDSKDSRKKSDKPSKVESKSSKGSKKSEPPVATVDNPAPDPIMDLMDEPAPEEAPSAAGWGFWGAGLKPSKSGKKATAGAEMSKEIGTPDAWANEGPGLTELPKMPEVTFADDGVKSATSPVGKLAKESSSSASTSKSKTTSKSSSIQDRIKALQGESVDPPSAKKSPDSRKSKDREAAPPHAPLPEREPLTTAEAEPAVVVVPPSPEDRKSSSKKSTSKTSSSKKDRKDLAPLDTDPVSVLPLSSTSPLPGGFPTDNFIPDMPASPPKSSAKTSKTLKSSKSVKTSKSDAKPDIVDRGLTNETFDGLMGLDDTTAKLPTPPPEKGSKDNSKGHKKERPKVVRDQGSNSWGFWGATPPATSSSKKDSRSKDGASSPVKERPATLSRSKSARKPTDQDPAEKASKSSGSDKDIKSASKARPSSSRGQSFGAMFGLGSTPSRSKSTRIPSSRRQSNAVDDTGMMSPPPEEREVSDKAAKLMGMNRSKSSRDTPKARKVPDPYAIDTDDMIMVDGPEDSAKDMPPAEKPSTSKEKSRRSKRESTMMSGGLGGADDAVMVDAPRDESKADDLAFDVRPPLVRRATTSTKKPGLMGGILGAFSSRPAAPDRRQSKAYDSDDGTSRRKRESAYDDDRSKRLRRDDRKVGRSRNAPDTDGATDCAPVTEAEDQEAKEARRAERRARRDREAAEEEARGARRAEREEARKAKAREESDRLKQEDEEREARRKEERRAKRAERETRRAEEDRLALEEEAKAAERRERRRERERERTEAEPAVRPTTSDRRRSYAPERPEDEEARRARREDRRLRRSVDPGTTATDKERPRTSRRRSDYPAPVDDYFDKRNGEPAPPPADEHNGRGEREADGRPYIKAGGDKTTSWVHSVNESPPPPPPVEGTIVDAPAHFAVDDGVPATHPFEETTARELRHKRGKEREGFGDGEEAERRRRSRREREGEGIKSSSGGSGYDRQQSYGGPANSTGFNDMGVKSWDGRPAVQRSESKRGSWFKKIAGGL